MALLLETPLLLLLLALALRALPLRVDRDEAWSTAVDLPLALALGLATAVAKAWWLALFVMMEGTDTSDMGDICVTVEALRDLNVLDVKRQPVAALLPTALSSVLGFFDGVSAASLLSAAGLGAALYLWARVLHSRAAGVAAAVFSCAFTPLVVMTRYLTFYPEAIAAYALCAAAVAAAVRWRTRATLGLAGGGVALALAADHMGLVYAVVPLIVALVVAFKPPRDRKDATERVAGRARPALKRWRRVLIRIGIFAAPVLLSWIVARLVTPGTMNTLEDKAIMFTQDNVGHDFLLKGTSPKKVAEPWHRDLLRKLVDRTPGRQRRGYNWGRSGPVGMARGLLTLALLSQEKPPGDVPQGDHQRATLAGGKASQITPWVPVALLALALTCVALWRRRWELVALLAVLAPFAVILKAVSETQVFPKYLMAPMAPIPVLLGVAWVTLANRAREKKQEKKSGWPVWAAAPAVHLVVVGALVFGLVPSWIAPGGSWRMKHATDDGFYRLYRANARTNLRPKTPCKRQFLQDNANGHPLAGRLYPQDRFKRRFSSVNERRRYDGGKKGGQPPTPKVRPPPTGPAPPLPGKGSSKDDKLPPPARGPKGPRY